LAARHRDRIVVQNLEGDIGVCCDSLADRKRTRMLKGAIAEILEDMSAAVEFRARDPVGAFTAHLHQALGVAVHPAGHRNSEHAQRSGQLSRFRVQNVTNCPVFGAKNGKISRKIEKNGKILVFYSSG
jgi:hypothetical protein